MTDKDLGTAAGDIFAKAFTLGYKTGHDYAIGSRPPLTAEQVEDVRLLAQRLRHISFRGGVQPLVISDALALLDALFLATEPAGEPTAERRSFPTIQDVPNNTLFHTHGGNGSSLFVRNQSGDLRLCLNAGPEWSKLMQEEDFLPSSGPYVEVPWSVYPQPPADPFAQPAPAEPSEEETKAEPSARQIADVIMEGRSQNMSWMQIAEMVKQVFFPASSPVVPAPTETGPCQFCDMKIGPHEGHAHWTPLVAPALVETVWPSLDAVPAEVRTVWDKSGDEWRRRKNGGWKFRSPGQNWVKATLPLDDYIDFAPFIAAPAQWDPELGTRNDWTLNEGTDK